MFIRLAALVLLAAFAASSATAQVRKNHVISVLEQGKAAVGFITNSLAPAGTFVTIGAASPAALAVIIAGLRR